LQRAGSDSHAIGDERLSAFGLCRDRKRQDGPDAPRRIRQRLRRIGGADARRTGNVTEAERQPIRQRHLRQCRTGEVAHAHGILHCIADFGDEHVRNLLHGQLRLRLQSDRCRIGLIVGPWRRAGVGHVG